MSQDNHIPTWIYLTIVPKSARPYKQKKKIPSFFQLGSWGCIIIKKEEWGNGWKLQQPALGFLPFAVEKTKYQKHSRPWPLHVTMKSCYNQCPSQAIDHSRVYLFGLFPNQPKPSLNVNWIFKKKKQKPTKLKGSKLQNTSSKNWKTTTKLEQITIVVCIWSILV